MPVSAFENLKLGNQLCFALYAATNAITRAYRSRLNEVGLTYPQYLVMMVLWQTDGVPVKTLAQQLQLDSATVTPLLKRLEAAGFVRRQRSSEDERVVRIHLSDQGRHLQPRVAEMQKAVACQTGLTESEFIELRSSLHQLADTMQHHRPAAQEAA